MNRLTTALVVLVVLAAVALLAPIAADSLKPSSHTSLVNTAQGAAPAPAVMANAPLQREVFGFVNDNNLGSSSVGYRTWNFSLLSTVAYFAMHVNSGDGALVRDNSWNIYHSPTMASFVSAAHAAETCAPRLPKPRAPRGLCGCRGLGAPRSYRGIDVRAAAR